MVLKRLNALTTLLHPYFPCKRPRNAPVTYKDQKLTISSYRYRNPHSQSPIIATTPVSQTRYRCPSNLFSTPQLSFHSHQSFPQVPFFTRFNYIYLAYIAGKRSRNSAAIHQTHFKRTYFNSYRRLP